MFFWRKLFFWIMIFVVRRSWFIISGCLLFWFLWYFFLRFFVLFGECWVVILDLILRKLLLWLLEFKLLSLKREMRWWSILLFILIVGWRFIVSIIIILWFVWSRRCLKFVWLCVISVRVYIWLVCICLLRFYIVLI